MKKLLKLSLLSFVLVLLSYSFVSAQWTEQVSGVTTALRELHVVSDNVAWIGGASSVILKTVNGTDWTSHPLPDAGYSIYSIYAFDATTAWAFASSGDMKIYKTTDGGATWVTQYTNAGGFGDGIRFFDANFGIAQGDPNPYPGTEWEILVTTNGGTNWTRIPNTQYPAAPMNDAGYVDAIAHFGNNVWFGTGSNGDVYKSTDKGNNWTKTKVTGVTDIFGIDFRDNNLGMLINFSSSTDGKFARTTDGGTTWNTFEGFANLRSICQVPSSTRWLAVGGSTSTGTTYISIDDGLTWTNVPITTARLRAVDASANNAWTVGDGGKIWKWSGPPLPVELTSFAAATVGMKVELKWSTASETNNRGFEVERQINENSNWVTIGFREGSGTTSDAKNYSFTDNLSDYTETSFSYRLKQLDFDGTFKYSDVVNVALNNLPSQFVLSQNYPNPFNPSTKIKYGIPYESNVKVTVFNALGELVGELVNSVQQPGFHEVIFDAKNISSGLYFYNIEASAVDGSGQFKDIKKMMLVR